MLSLTNPSQMLNPPNNIPPDLCPVNLLIQLLVHEPAHHDILSPYQVHPMLDLGAWLFIVCRSDDALDGLGEDDVGQLIAGEEIAG